MAVLAVAGVGALGTAALGFGWQAGWLIGGLVGQALFGPRLPNQEGPRLSDLSVTSSAYGAPIPICYGTLRMGGNMIWSTGLIETVSTERVGGKGGSRGQRVTSYVYHASFAIAFGEGPADQVLRIWADGKLIFDRTGGSGDIPASQTLQRDGFRMRFYRGDETQLPDPAMVAQEGAGQVPAHRGLCYIVFEDFELRDFGNRIPQITAEISYAAVPDYPVQPLEFTAGPLGSFARTELAVDWDRGRGFLAGGSPAGLYRFNSRAMQIDRQVLQADILDPALAVSGSGFDTLYCGSDGFLYATIGVGNARPIVRIDPDALREVNRFGSYGISTANSTTRFAFAQRMAMITRGGASFLLTANGTGPAHLGLLRCADMRYLWHENTTGQPIASLVGGREAEGWALSGSASLMRLHRIVISDGSLGMTAARSIAAAFTPQDIDPEASEFAPAELGGLTFDPTDGGLVFWCAVAGTGSGVRYYLVKWRPGLGLLWRRRVPFTPTGFANQQAPSGARIIGTSFAYAAQAGSYWRVVQVDLRTGTITLDANGWFHGASGLGGTQVYDGVTDSLIAYDPNARFARLYLGRANAQGVSLGSIVADLCRRGGLMAADMDVNELSASVPGYVLGRQSSIRAAIEPLAQAFFFDGVESDDRLAFRPRGSGAGAVLQAPHLIRLDDETGAAWRARREQEVDLPARINVLYMDKGADYAQGSQTARRIASPVATMASRNEVTLELPMALSAGAAKSIAARLLYTAWTERSSYEARLPSDYLRLEPSDVVSLTLPSGGSFRARLERVDLGADLSLAIQARAQEAADYATELVADGGIGRPAPGITLYSQTQLFLPDMPLLRDTDDPGTLVARRYVMMAGLNAGDWRGGDLWRSADGASWGVVAANRTAVAWGVLTQPFPPPRAVFATDEASVLSITMVVGSGRLESVPQAAMLNGANAALLLRPDGTPEIVQFRAVLPEGENSFTLRGFLRGRRGTDVFAATPHPVGTRFLLLEDASAETVLQAIGELGLLRQWRAVSVGGSFDTAPVLNDIAIGRSLMPYAPVHPMAAWVGPDIQISWTRRTRVGGDLRDGTGSVPLAEDVEAYEVDILSGPAGSSGSTVLRTLSTTSPSALYDAADIAADFASPPAALCVRICQMSSAIGRGFPREAILTLA